MIRSVGRESFIEHLALTLELNRAIDAPETCLMAMLSAYFDDSGAYGSTPTTVVTGFVATVDQWLLFDRDWRAVLQMPQFDLEHLHMKELRSGKGRFAKFTDNLPLQRDLFDRLQRLMRVRTLETFSGAVVHRDYDVVNRDYQVAEAQGSPILMASQLAIVKLMKWKEEVRPSDSIRIVFDQGIKDWGILDERVLNKYGFRLIPAKVSETPPLQAGDLAAWEIHRGLAVALTAPEKRMRGSLVALLNRFGATADDYRRLNWFLYDEDEMRRVFELTDGPPRRVASCEQPILDGGQS